MAVAQVVAGRWTYPYGGENAPKPWGPHPKQATAHRQVAKEILFGGAAGPGKTDWLLAEVLRPCFLYEGFPALIIRRTFQHLAQRSGIIERLRTRIPPSVGHYNSTEHVWRFRNGSSLQLGYLASDVDVERYVGGEYGIIGWDQVEQLTEFQYTRLFHPLRLPEHHPAVVAGFVPHMACTANPGGTGHMWVKDRWIDPAPPGLVWQPTPTDDEPNPGPRVFIPATLEDNPSMPTWYREQLDAIKDPALRRALAVGDWDIYAGARFGHLFKRSIHVVEPEDWPIPEGAGIPRGLACDYGLEHPWCALWGAVFSDGLVVIYRELHSSGLTPREQADQIRAVEKANNERSPGRPMPTALSPDAWRRDPSEKSTAHRVKGANVSRVSAGNAGPPRGSIAWHYHQAGVPAQRANDDRLSGTMLIADKLGIRRDGRPRLLIYSTCLNLIRTLPALPRDKDNPELYQKQDGDDAVDTLRYLLQLISPGDYTPPPGDADHRPPSSGDARAETAGWRDRPM
jgi:hypothetical protein